MMLQVTKIIVYLKKDGLQLCIQSLRHRLLVVVDCFSIHVHSDLIRTWIITWLHVSCIACEKFHTRTLCKRYSHHKCTCTIVVSLLLLHVHSTHNLTDTGNFSNTCSMKNTSHDHVCGKLCMWVMGKWLACRCELLILVRKLNDWLSVSLQCTWDGCCQEKARHCMWGMFKLKWDIP